MYNKSDVGSGGGVTCDESQSVDMSQNNGPMLGLAAAGEVPTTLLDVHSSEESSVGSHSRAAMLQNVTQFGPGCRPIFYTALLHQPQWLAWCPIPNVAICDVFLVDTETGALVWSATALDSGGFRWQVPQLDLIRGRVYQWCVHPSSSKVKIAGSHQAYGNAFPATPETDRIARFWLISNEEQARFATGLAMLRERADPAFLAIAESLFLAEFQMYHHALIRLPSGKPRGAAALDTLIATTRSVIFRQMNQHMKRMGGESACLARWAELNEQYYRNQTETRLHNVEQQSNNDEYRGPDRRRPSNRADSAGKLRQQVFK